MLPELVATVVPAVVHVDVTRADGRGNGSGFCVAPLTEGKATILTNAHVVESLVSATAILRDHASYPATVRAVDRSTDVAILEIDVPAPHVLEFRPVREVRVGEQVIAIGSPYGYAGTVTSGIVSALDRTMYAPDRTPIDRMVQTDALIGPGNSGGPLIGLDGRVIGINDQIAIGLGGAPTGLGFAISADTAIAILEEVRRSPDGRIRRATIRARLQRFPLEAALRSQLHQASGAVLFEDPAPGTPSAAAGLRKGDVVVRLRDEVVDEPADVFRLLDSTVIGAELPVRFLRDGVLTEARVTPIERTG